MVTTSTSDLPTNCSDEAILSSSDGFTAFRVPHESLSGDTPSLVAVQRKGVL